MEMNSILIFSFNGARKFGRYVNLIEQHVDSCRISTLEVKYHTIHACGFTVFLF